MWESRRDFQRVWEGWEAGVMAFHAFHTLSFPWPASRPASLPYSAYFPRTGPATYHGSTFSRLHGWHSEWARKRFSL
jgi:hypothetical protein